ncbi:MAG: hypothetical protein NC218_10065, partial [Acetobacter sp.]|nr:hypothetical protein [Acetobacter sp.]
MTKKLILIAFAAFGILCSGVAEAKVCRTGDTSCETYPWDGKSQCGAEYIKCSIPRAGSTYCEDGDGKKYRREDCCSELGFVECPVADALVGVGDQCVGTDNVEYFESCGCSYGFAECKGKDCEGVAGSDSETKLTEDGINEIKNPNGSSVLYTARCQWERDGAGGGRYEYGNDKIKCRLAQCNEDRHFYSGIVDKEWCKLREKTLCGGFGCMQVYDCDNSKHYYRNASMYLDGSTDENNDWERKSGKIINFIDYLSSDVRSNEKDTSNKERVLYVNDTDRGSYNLTDMIVCAYNGDPEVGAHDNRGWDKGYGFGCGSTTPNYCYKYTGCNTVRRWYNNSNHMGIVYEDTYSKWLQHVEHVVGYPFYESNTIYSDSYRKFHENFLKDVNPGYGVYKKFTGVEGRESEGQNGSTCGKNNVNCTVPDGAVLGTALIYEGDEFVGYNANEKSYGCTYIQQSCHGENNCYKKISCTEENRFYHSFINAADKSLYESSLNTPLYSVWYKGLNTKEIYPACEYQVNECNDSTGCYRKVGCAAGFEDLRAHPDVAEDWSDWFSEIRSLCNDNTRCYKATACELTVGSYSSTPNTSFFVTAHSTATGLTCYRGSECWIEVGAYTSTPNTSFFAAIQSLATGSTCYRGQNCYIQGGSYSSVPNTSFFVTINSKSSGSTCYRGQNCYIAGGAYSSTPNTSFFNVIASKASGSTAYRGESGNIVVGAYTSTPNTSFFFVIKSVASGSTAYRGQESHIKAGSYSSAPNTSFFNIISSKASGSTAYRGESDRINAGAYTSTPNTSFFFVIKSAASGSTAYRGQESHIKAGSYSSAPNTSFFNIISSKASGSTAYRGESGRINAGAYTSTPNTSFFFVIKSAASGSTAYRGQEAHLKAGSYSSSPNTSFFAVIKSLASGSTCYRGQNCHFDKGVYSSTPNTSFFNVIASLASGSGCYRGQDCSIKGGSYSSTPNTSFFAVINSISSGSICYRGQTCYIPGGAYSSTPNTSFFVPINSLASGSTCYRGQNCYIANGAYSSTPNTVFFVPINSLASGSTCYRGQNCAATSNDTANTSFFVFVNSQASGSTCYRSSACRFSVGAYSSVPNTSFFVTQTMQNADLDSICYRGSSCNFSGGSYSSTPNTSFFNVIKSVASGSTAYRGEDVCLECGSYSSTPNTSFFRVISSKASGSTAYRGEESHLKAGAYSSMPNTSFFNTISSKASGSTAYRGESGRVNAGAYTSTPNTSFFFVIKSSASGSTAYRGQESHIPAGAYSSMPNTKFFNVISSKASGSTAYRGESGNIVVGAYTSTPNTSFFFVIKSAASGSTAYRGQESHIKAGAYSSAPNTKFFNVISSKASGSTAYRGESANLKAGAYSSTPNTKFFYVVNSSASGSICYRGESCNATKGDAAASTGTHVKLINTSFFHEIQSQASGVTCYRGDDCATKRGSYNASPNTNYFDVISSTSPSSKECFRAQGCNIKVGAYTSVPNTSFFLFTSVSASGSICYRGAGCHLNAGAYVSSPDTSFFSTISSTATGTTYFRAESVNLKAGAYSSTPNTKFFNVAMKEASSSKAYRGTAAAIAVGAYSSKPNTYFFNVVSSLASGSTSYRAVSIVNGYTSSPNTSFFIVAHSHASGSSAYRGEKAHIAAGAYSSTPSTSFFKVVYSLSSGSKSYRAQDVAAAAGAYKSSPDTRYFKTVSSLASGTISYRATACVDDAINDQNTTTKPTLSAKINSSFFTITDKSASGSICYRGDDCVPQAYSSAPNTEYFNTVKSTSPSGMICYRAGGNKDTDPACKLDKGAYSVSPNTAFFNVTSSSATGVTCWRENGCATGRGAYASSPDTLFFITNRSVAAGRYCYRATACSATAYKDETTLGKPDEFNTSFFFPTGKNASSLQCWRADSCHLDAGAYSSIPNTKFFLTTSQTSKKPTTCYRGTGCNASAGAYVASPNTMFFATVSSSASGNACYRGTGCATGNGAYATTPNTSFFYTIASAASGVTCYRVDPGTVNPDGPCRVGETSNDIPCYFNATSSTASGITCWKGNSCKYTNINTQYFETAKATYGVECSYIKSPKCTGPYAGFTSTAFNGGLGGTSVTGGDATCKKVEAIYPTGCDASAHYCATNASVNTTYFTKTEKEASGCGHTVKCNYITVNTKTPAGGVGSCATAFGSMFNQSTTENCGVKAYYLTGGCTAGWSTAKPNTIYFLYTSTSVTDCTGKSETCYKATGCAITTTPACYFGDKTVTAPNGITDNGQACRSGFDCKYPNINTQYFSKASTTYGEATCDYITGPNCAITNPTAFAYSSTSQSGRVDCSTATAYFATSCNGSKGYYEGTPAKPDYFNYTSDSVEKNKNCNVWKDATCTKASCKYPNCIANSQYFVIDKASFGNSGDCGYGLSYKYTSVAPASYCSYTSTSGTTCSNSLTGTAYLRNGCATGYTSGTITNDQNAYLIATAGQCPVDSNGSSTNVTCKYVSGCNTGWYYLGGDVPDNLFFSKADADSESDTAGYGDVECSTVTCKYTPDAGFFKTTSATISLKNGWRSDATSTNKTCYRASGCLYTSSNNSDYFHFSSAVSGTTCYRASSCKYTSSQPAAYCRYTSSSASTMGLTVSGDKCYYGTGCASDYTSDPNKIDTNIYARKNAGSCLNGETTQSCYYSDGCNTDKGYYYVVRGDYHTGDYVDDVEYTGEHSDYENCGQAVCKRGYGSKTNTSYFNWIGGTKATGQATWNSEATTVYETGVGCYRESSCVYGNWSEECTDTSYFTISKGNDAVTGTYNTALKCLKGFVDKSQKNEDCRQPANALKVPNHDLYIWGESKTCDDMTVSKPTGCNANAGSHNSSYVSSGTSTGITMS